MLHRYINQFLEYCRLADFSNHSIEALSARLNEFEACRKSQRIRFVKQVTYRHLIDFVADYKAPSIHVRKSRVWTLRQFYHFLTLHRHVPQNIALKLPYRKIEKTVPQFLTLPAIPCGTAWLLTLTIKTLTSWSSRVFSGICQRAVPNHTSILLKIESAGQWRSCQVLNLSKN